MKHGEQAIFQAIRSALVAVLVLGLPAVARSAIAADARLLISATVLKHASLTALSQPQSLVITSADLAQGYVELPDAVQMAIKSNTRNGYMLVFDVDATFVEATWVRGLQNKIQLSATGGVVPLPASGHGMSVSTHDLGLRFLLAPSARAGVYLWPMRVSVVPM
jgi:hypothetical protein